MTHLTDELREASMEATQQIRARNLMQAAAGELEKVELEADRLAQEAASESARANAAEARVEELEPTIPPDYLNVP